MRSILVKFNGTGAASNIQVPIDIPFQPDVVEFRNLTIVTTGGNNNISIRANDLPLEYGNNQVLAASIVNNGYYNIPMSNVFNIVGPVKGNYNFQILSITNQAINFTGQIMFFMNFIKFGI